ncbi:hypothetical protein VCRA2113O415_390003 [Vibrio crassostreae]|nr:hypothetical protein VCRA2110O182_170066 [Vibrio crassostreae]CAK2276842.1 hypothetical protein VCRA2111O408_160066 [Vibrio crassostreae]CAK2291862.1 hypothetical protein VCRA211O406_170037 [Vibrio crassostreae]CAK2488362.1 hypothetical protein VCRA2113O415_390003 [Vibrio crassostreae]CAK2819470.1 hypothetical protein VCRA2113O420_370003 [Vibrio crassostreae]
MFFEGETTYTLLIAVFCRYLEKQNVSYKKAASIGVIRTYGIAHKAKNRLLMNSSSPLDR